MLTKETIVEAHRYAPKLWLIAPVNEVVQSDINAVLVEVSEVICDALISDIEYMRRVYDGGLVEWGSTHLDTIGLRAWFLPAEWLDRMMCFADREDQSETWDEFLFAWGSHPKCTLHPYVDVLTMQSVHTISRNTRQFDTPIVLQKKAPWTQYPVFYESVLDYLYCLGDGEECLEIEDGTLHISQNAAWFTARNEWNKAHLHSFSIWVQTWEEIRQVFTRVKREV